jgi:hypothetical protein
MGDCPTFKQPAQNRQIKNDKPKRGHYREPGNFVPAVFAINVQLLATGCMQRNCL